MKKLTFISILIFSNALFAKDIKCSMNFSSKVISLNEDKTVTLSSSEETRVPASNAIPGRRVKQLNGFEQTFSHDGKDYIIKIQDQDSLSENSDYMIIKARSGHQVMYPLLCK